MSIPKFTLDSVPPVSGDPKISIITVSYNQGKFIRHNIESVLAQDYPNVEHVIIDGGSTDETLSILKEYPHLKWVSEPDRGQSHALNKGFKKATGEFLGWINSDDFLEPNSLSAVVAALKEAPVVMGMCEKSDREGKGIEVNPNVARNFYDILKYWVMFSTPDQPGVFFRKSSLEAVKLPNGDYIDEGLEYCMDVELWMRLAKKFPFNKRVPKVTSHFRWYEDSKTGSNMAAAYRETSRIFIRHSAKDIGEHERLLSCIIPVRELTPPIKETLASLSTQSNRDFEVIIADYGNSRDVSRVLRRSVLDFGALYTSTPIRYHRAEIPENGVENYFSAVNSAIGVTAAPLIAVIEPGVRLPVEFTLAVTANFTIDMYGLALPLKGHDELLNQITLKHEGHRYFSPGSTLSMPWVPPTFVARKIALMDLGGFKSWMDPILVMKELIWRMSYKSWTVSVDNPLAVDRGLMPRPSNEHESMAILLNYVNAKLILDVTEEARADPFSETRSKNGVNLQLTPPMVEYSQRLLNGAPAGWERDLASWDRERLEEATKQYPGFGPGWYFLSKKYKELGQLSAADTLYAQFLAAKGGERFLP